MAEECRVMPISTHKMLAAANQANNAQITDQASTLSGNTKTFWDCSETTPTLVTDVVGSLVLNNATDGVTITTGEVDGRMVRMLLYPENGQVTNGSLPDPGTQDYIVVVCGRAISDGNIGFYYGARSEGQMRVQPYYASFHDDTDPNPLTRSTAFTGEATEYSTRTAGEDYMFAGWKSGDMLHHAADGVRTGTVNVTTHHDGYLATQWANQVSRGNACQLGHAGNGELASCTQIALEGGVCEVLGQPVPGGWTNVTNQAQDIYGILIHFFPNGAPSSAEIENGLKWMKPRWLAGDKVIYPGWMY